jgi:hypothetical protein
MFKVQDFLPLPEDASVRGVEVSSVARRSVVPASLGPGDRALIRETCLVVVFWSEQQERTARDVLAGLQEGGGVELARSAGIAVRREDAERVFGRWGDLVARGQVGHVTLTIAPVQVIGLELVGPGSLEAGAAAAGPGVGASTGQDQAEADVLGLFGIAEMQRGF